ncbi:MAG: shikimate dehydrogenase [Mycobacterium sp.]|jgi:shikimate dehydrogenase|nr:shikimate dehydrogenase [Mycobacterium sp.]
MNALSPYQVALIGSDLSLSLAKVIHERAARELGLDAVYRVLDVRDDPSHADLSGTLARLQREGYLGTNITHPFKKSVIAELDGLSEDAQALGAVNTVVFTDGKRIGHNTDWYGFARSLDTWLGQVDKRTVVQLGAGGAGVAVAHALLRAGVENLILLGRDPGRTAASADALLRVHPSATIRADTLDELPGYIGSADGLVNATPMGMPAHPGSPVPASLLDARLWVHEVVYQPLQTELMRQARAAGCLTVGGEHMFVHQAQENFRLFTGIQPSPQRMLAHLKEIVEARAQPAPSIAG